MRSILKVLAKSSYANQVDRFLSRQLMSTNIGIHFHIMGYSRIRKARKAYAGNNNCKHPEVSAALRHQGLAPKKESYAPELMKTIRTKYNSLIEKEGMFVSWDGKTYGPKPNLMHLLSFPVEKIPEIAQLIDHDVRQQMENYYGTYFEVMRITAWRNYSIPPEMEGKEIFSNHWHFDLRPTDLANLFVNISDVTEKDGPFHIQSKQRTNQLMKMGFNTRDDYALPPDVMDDPKYVNRLTGPSGTGMYATTHTCMHRAGIPEKGHYRDIIAFQFRPSEKRLPEDWAAYYKNPEQDFY